MYAQPALVRPRFASDLDQQAALWITRLSISSSSAMFQLNNSLYSEELRQMIGVAPREGKFSTSDLRPLLKARADELARPRLRRKTVFARNVAMLGDLLGMDAVQREVIAFVALSQHHPYLLEIVENIRTTSSDGIVRMLCTALGLSDQDARRALRPDSLLLATRIISIERSETVRGLQLVVPSGLNAALFSAADNIKMLMGAFLEQAPRPSLTAEAFPHLAEETALLTNYLSKLNGGTPGVNVLIYGPPGTGKTEYVRWLATQLRRTLYQVKATDEEGKAIVGVDRLAFFQIAQRFLQSSNAVILFDEIEDVFPSADAGPEVFGGQRRSRPGKMFINRMLESNAVPAIWISNEVSHIDKAYLRRFDFSFEMGNPPTAVRRKILRSYLHDCAITDETIAHLSQQDALSPAQIEKAAKVVRLACRKPKQQEATLLFVLDNSMELLQQEQTDQVLNFAECSYRIDYLNSDCDLSKLVTQLKRADDATGAICFYGAPGTGKTALAHYLAREIDMPILVRRASDILSSYVGETEQKIAAMFKQAKRETSMLLLDEADSFLTERKEARNTWEITAVNEMLTQMERFEGLFICSTNLMQKLDEASLRRFALKIKFDYLRPEQRWRLFLDQAKTLRGGRESEFRTALSQLNNLTPGDFATVRRQTTLLGVTLTAEELLNRLTQECKNKRGSASRPIGFVHS